MDEFYTISENTSAEISEKKSKFLANLFYIENRLEAEQIIKETKKKYHDARHNCIAYRVIDGDCVIEKSSDDGEPSGTAGLPMLEILKKHNLCNVLVIVTRYFGGILLGTGGLARAYSEATLRTLQHSSKVVKCKGIEAEVELEYNNLDNFKYYCKNLNINITNIEYLDTAICKIELENAIKEKLKNDIDTKQNNIKHFKILCEKYVNKSVKNKAFIK